MIIVNNTSDIRKQLSAIRDKKKIALVPTMGNIHAGHLQLVQRARELADEVVVSIFVNPLQFAPHEDFDTYPRTLTEDIKKLTDCKVNILFAPSTKEMYAELDDHTQVKVPKISDVYCGHFRPQFFYGVTTVVTKLFNIIQPDISIFGEKDFQQLFIIKKMVADLSFPIEIISVPVMREPDGLAMSSRNQHLTADERRTATELYKILCSIRDRLSHGKLPHNEIIEEAIANLTRQNFKVDYLEVCNQETLEHATSHDKELVILIAAWLGKTRLIDNISFTVAKS